MPKISIICPTYNEEKYIEKCIESMLSQDVDKADIELLFVDGRSTDKTREIILGFQKTHPFIQIIDNPERTVPFAMNYGIDASQGEIIVRIDAHSEFPPNYISVLKEQLYKLNADNVGPVCLTLPANQTTEAKAIATALSSSFGVGNAYFRIGADKIMEVDTVPFGCFKRETFDKIGKYDVELTRNQDDEFNARIIKNGGKIFLIPDLVVKYYVRDTIKKTRKMYYQYGLFKPLVNEKIGSPATTRQFFPMLFVLGLIFGLALSFVHPFFLYSYISVISFYITAALVFSFKDAKEKKEIIYLPYIFLTIHLAYGWGYLVGISKIVTGKNFNAQINR
ncbi:glycosyltransferase family 2 protein [Brumimicrobium glaciale]|uniref:glycosyltransferase family 2 protein n=1 Tax=Brumimicrobium glaciale TaxID=200475 RepID=UPI001A91BFA0|nr:glycosyltransferase family 2 protein [Brumimicrobium glaciale]